MSYATRNRRTATLQPGGGAARDQRRLTPAGWVRRLLRVSAGLCLALSTQIAISGPARSITGTYTVALIQVTYADAGTHLYSQTQLRSAAGEMNRYFHALSNDKLSVTVRVGQAIFTDPTQTRGFFWDSCAADGTEARTPCPPPLLQDAVDGAVANGLSMAGVQGVVVLSPWDAGDYTLGPATVRVGGTTVTVQQSYDFESPTSPVLAPPGPSQVYWNGWAHEIGHQIQHQSGITLYGSWNGHPGGYASGYDLMDSGYPLGESVYGLSHPDVGDKSIFPEWLDPVHVRTVPAPTSGTVTTTFHLTAMGATPTASSSDIRGLKLTIYPGVYLTVEARRNLGADSFGTGPGLFDQGIKMDSVEEQGDPPEHPIDACDYLVTGGCVKSNADPRWPTCPAIPVNLASSHPYCYPYELWHPGATFHDTGDNLSVAVGAFDSAHNSYTVHVTRGPNTRHPDLALTPWQSAPMHTWETSDIWIDSSCNGFGTYRYGQRADGTAVGNGDDPCANHPNRLYARVRNIGTAPASHVVVNFASTDPLGVGIEGARGWAGVGTATEATFPGLASIAAGAYIDVYVTWNPAVDPSALPDPSDFAFHSCVRVTVNPVPGEIVLDNQDGNGEQENFQYFQAVVDPPGGGRRTSAAGQPLTITGQIQLINIDSKKVTTPRTYYLESHGTLPTGGQYSFANGASSVTLRPGEIRTLPIKFAIPSNSPAGIVYQVKVDALTLTTETNPAIPPGASMPGPTHIEGGVVSGAVLALHTVTASSIKLAATEDQANNTKVDGQLSPAATGQIVTIDYLTEFGDVITHHIKVGASGELVDELLGSKGSVVQVRAIYTGTMTNSSAVTQTTPVPLTAQQRR